MGNRLKGFLSWFGSALSWVAEKLWGDQAFAWIKPMIPAEYTSLEVALRWMWEWGIPGALILLGAYFYFVRRPSGHRGDPIPAGLPISPPSAPIIRLQPIQRGGDVHLGPGTYRAGDGGPGGRGGDLIIKAGDAAPASRSPRPDLTLDELVTGFTLGTNENDHLETLGSLFAAIQQEAVLGSVTTWGRLNCPIGQSHTPLTAMPASHWRDHQIDLLDFLCDPERRPGKTNRSGILPDNDYYSDLRLNRDQVAAIWPPKEPTA